MGARNGLVSLIAVHATLMFVGYFGLVAVFDFPDVLRAEPAQILAAFRAERPLVKGFYAAFMWSQVAFVCVVLAIGARFGDTSSSLLRASTHLGVIAGFAQAVGFARWPFAVGALAERQSEATATTHAVFEALHNFAGVAVGEHLFFCFEALWAVSLGLHLQGRRNTAPATPSGGLLVAIGVAIGVYSLEQFGGPFAILAPVNVLAHGALLYWLIGLAITQVANRRLRPWEAGGLALLWAATVMG